MASGVGNFDIHYLSWPAVKVQALANFIVECTINEEEKSLEQPETEKPSGYLKENELDLWRLHVEESSNELGSGACIVVESPDVVIIEYALKFEFKVSNMP